MVHSRNSRTGDDSGVLTMMRFCTMARLPVKFPPLTAFPSIIRQRVLRGMSVLFELVLNCTLVDCGTVWVVIGLLQEDVSLGVVERSCIVADFIENIPSSLVVPDGPFGTNPVLVFLWTWRRLALEMHVAILIGISPFPGLFIAIVSYLLVPSYLLGRRLKVVLVIWLLDGVWTASLSTLCLSIETCRAIVVSLLDVIGVLDVAL